VYAEPLLAAGSVVKMADSLGSIGRESTAHDIPLVWGILPIVVRSDQCAGTVMQFQRRIAQGVRHSNCRERWSDGTNHEALWRIAENDESADQRVVARTDLQACGNVGGVHGVLVTVTPNDCEAVAPFASVAVTVMFALPAPFPCTKRPLEITLAEAMVALSLLAEKTSGRLIVVTITRFFNLGNSESKSIRGKVAKSANP
jgi:hypothetical protein